MKVVIALDDSAYSTEVLREVCKRKWPDDTQFKILQILTPVDWQETGDRNWDSVIEEAHLRRLNSARSHCAKARKQLEDSIANCTVHYEIKEGNAKTQIIDSALSWSADKIVLGAHGTNVCPRFILGSISRAVAAHAPCSVEIIRPGNKDARPHAVSSKGRSRGNKAG